jgi:hypothetical protein
MMSNHGACFKVDSRGKAVFSANPSTFDPRHVLTGLRVHPDHFAGSHVFGHQHGNPVGQFGRLVPVGGRGTLDRRRRVHDFQIDGLGQFNAQRVAVPEQCRDALQAVNQPLGLPF